jgi:hypothetical protein
VKCLIGCDIRHGEVGSENFLVQPDDRLPGMDLIWTRSHPGGVIDCVCDRPDGEV